MTSDNKDWDVVIDCNGPVDKSFFLELWNKWDLILILARRDLITAYKQTLLGPLWIIIQPILTTLMYFFVFDGIAGVSTDGIPSLIFYLTGVTFWTLFSSIFVFTSDLLIQNEHLFSKVYFPRIAVVLSGVLSNLVKFSVQLGILISTVVYYHIFHSLDLQFKSTILILVAMIALLAMAVGLGLLFSSLNIKYKDLRQLHTFVVQIFMYLSCVVFPYSVLSDKIGTILWWNPLVHIFEVIRFSIFGVGQIDLNGALYTGLIAALVLSFGVLVFNRVVHAFVDSI